MSDEERQELLRMNGDLQQKVVDLSDHREHLLDTLTKLKRQVETLKTKQLKQAEDDTDAKRVAEIGDYWRQRCNHPKAKVPADGERAQKVRARLNEGYTVEEIKRAIDGVARFPFVRDAKRVASGAAAERNDDLELICRSEKRVEKFAGLLDSTPVPAPQPSPGGSGLAITPSPLDRAVSALRSEWGREKVFPIWNDELPDAEPLKDGEVPKAAYYLSPCPIQPHDGHISLKVYEWSRRGAITAACLHGHTEEDLLDAIRQVELRHDDRWAQAVARARGVAA